jgi:hypothetical protein
MDHPLIIKGELPTLNKEIGAAKLHWAIYSNHKRKFTQLISALSKRYKHIHPQTYPIPNRLHISLNWFVKNKKKDPDNCYFAVKYILDGMVDGGILEGDGFKHISSIIHTIEVDKEEPRVEVRWFDADKHKATIQFIE